MKAKKSLYANRIFLGFVLSLTIPSIGQVQKYLGNFGVVGYLAVVVILLSMLFRYKAISFLLKIVSEKQAFYICLATILFLLVIFFNVYPLVNLGIVGGGSDRDEDNTIATIELLHGRYPYYVKTYLGNTITHFPGSLLLAVPFVLLGNSAYQNFFWLFMFVITAGFYLKSWRLSLFLLWSIIFLSPVFMQELVTGGDLISNGVYILTFMFFLVDSLSGKRQSQAKGILFAVLLGIGLSSRLNFIFLLPLLFSCILQNTRWPVSLKYMVLACVICAIVTLPFYLYNPKGFSPLYGQFHKITEFDFIFPSAAIALLVVGTVISITLSFTRMKNDCVVLFRNCAIVQAFFVLSCVFFAILQSRSVNLILSGYGLSFLFFGTLAYLHELKRDYAENSPC
ncbi:MAG: hypothetical protein NT066_05995 [Candidatus Omnitrophica bacterium]|nr:hypothetical protein [Candidatus Omnitrophota bacterium]